MIYNYKIIEKLLLSIFMISMLSPGCSEGFLTWLEILLERALNLGGFRKDFSEPCKLGFLFADICFKRE